MRVENLIANILRCDLDKVNSILKQLENDSRNNNEAYIDRIKRVINERITGNRNIIHAAVFSCAPVSNKDVENTTTSGLTIPKPFERSWSNKGLATAATGTPTLSTTTTSIGNENTIEINAAINDHSYENRSMDTTGAIPTSFLPPLDIVLSDNNTKSKDTSFEHQ
jgi:hypothetical protein